MYVLKISFDNFLESIQQSSSVKLVMVAIFSGKTICAFSE
jgi:hypothetical protein